MKLMVALISRDDLSKKIEPRLKSVGISTPVKTFTEAARRPEHREYVDPEYVYCSGQKETGEVVLARLELLHDSGFSKLQVSLLPAGEASRPLDEVMAAAIEEGAWD